MNELVIPTRVWIAIVVTIIITSVIGYTIYDLNKSVGYYKSLYEEEVTDHKKTTEASLIKTVNIATLKSAIKTSNEKNLALENELNASKAEYELWKTQPPLIKYKDRVVREIVTEVKYRDPVYDCNASMELDKKIGEIKYENI